MPTVNPVFLKWFNTHSRFVHSKAGEPFFRSKEKLPKIIVSQRKSWFSAIMAHDYFITLNPAGIYLFKINNRNTRTRC